MSKAVLNDVQDGPTDHEPQPAWRHSRTVVRWSARHLLRSLEIARELHGGDVMQTVVFAAIWSLNVAHLQPEAGYGEMESIPPDSVRRPVSVHRLARFLDLPHETVRRYVAKLIEQQKCERVGRSGVIVPRRVFEAAPYRDAAQRQLRATLSLWRAINSIAPAYLPNLDPVRSHQR